MEKALKRLQEAQRQLERQKLEAERLIDEGRRVVPAVKSEKVKALPPSTTQMHPPDAD